MSEARPIHALLNAATSENLPTDDWEIILEITDRLNESPDESFASFFLVLFSIHFETQFLFIERVPLLMKLIEKKFQHNQSTKVLMLTVTILDACVKNCPTFRKSFGTSKHLLFLSDFVESSKNQAVVDAIKNCLKQWTEAFGQKYENFGFTFKFFSFSFFRKSNF